MWDLGLRFSFGYRPPLPNEEATILYPLREESANHKTAGGSCDDVTSSHSIHAVTESTSSPLCVLASDASFADAETSSIDIQSPTSLNTNMDGWSFELEQRKYKVKQELLNKSHSHNESEGLQPKSDIQKPMSELGPEHGILIQAKKIAQATTHPTLTALERTELESLLAPVVRRLRALKKTTPESLPPYNSRVRAKSHPEVLKSRLILIGEHILSILARTPEGKRGLLEMKLCRYIAEEHWPLPFDATTHLRIQEMYRNGIFTRRAQAEAKARAKAEKMRRLRLKAAED